MKIVKMKKKPKNITKKKGNDSNSLAKKSDEKQAVSQNFSTDSSTDTTIIRDGEKKNLFHPKDKTLFINFSKQIFFACLLSLGLTTYTIFYLLTNGLNMGIDFSGGILMELSIHTNNIESEVEQLRKEINLDYPGANIQYSLNSEKDIKGEMIAVDTEIGNPISITAKTTEKQYNIIIRLHSEQSKEESNAKILKIINNIFTLPTKNNYTPNSSTSNKQDETRSSSQAINITTSPEITEIFSMQHSKAVLQRMDYVGPKAGSDFFINGIKALLISMLAMLAYIWFRFEWRFAIGVVISLLHDALATIGFYSITRFEFDLTSVAAILTIIGYSVNDSVVIYDRIRENKVKTYGKYSIEKIIDTSLNETLSRTVMTVGTTLAVCLSLAIYGGSILRGFSCALLFGIAFGTYSSMYISTAVLMPKKYFIQQINYILKR